MIHKVFLRLPDGAKLSDDSAKKGSIAIECPAAELDELCKWLRLTASSLDGNLLAHLEESVDQAVRTRALMDAVEECELFSKSAQTEEAKAVAMNIAVRIRNRSKRKPERTKGKR